jgi:tRNA wybutosine-synthesizing protein 4
MQVWYIPPIPSNLATFCILEQITPAGPSHPFASTMINHFNKLTTPLQSLTKYPTLNSQGRRFLDEGYLHIEASDLHTFFYSIMSPEKRKEALSMELFDEFEELDTFLGHYFILVANNLSRTQSYLAPSKRQEIDEVVERQYIKWKRESVPMSHISQGTQTAQVNDRVDLTSMENIKPPHRRFSAIAVAGRKDGFLIHGGLSDATRVSTSLQLCRESAPTIFETEKTPSARMCHTLTSLGDQRVLLVGGREAPNVVLNDTWIFDGEWKRVEDIPIDGGIYRHAAVQIGPGKVIVYGGRHYKNFVSDEWFLYTLGQGWQGIPTGDRMDDWRPALWGASLVWRKWDHGGGGLGYLLGGVNEEGICTGDTYRWDLELNSWNPSVRVDTVTVEKDSLARDQLSLTCRYGAKVIPWGDEEFLVIGGVGGRKVIPWSEQFVLIRPRFIRAMEVPCCEDVEQWFIGHDVAVYEKTGDVVIFGGGGVCFSFGAFWNERIFQLHFPMNTAERTITWKLVEQASVKVSAPKAYCTSTDRNSFSQPIRRVQIKSPDDWHQIVERSEVCILEGVDFGSCIDTWTSKSLKEKVGAEKQVIIHATDADAMNFLAKNFTYTSTSFAEFIDTVFSETSRKVYLRAVSEDAKSKPARLEDDFPSLAQDFKIPGILYGDRGIPRDRIFSSILRIGAVGTSIWLHYDVHSSRTTNNR